MNVHQKEIWGMGVIIGLVLLTVSSGYSWQFNCDPVNQAKFCLCTKGDNGGASWDIACPAKLLEVHPVALKLMISPYDQEEASLRVICDPSLNEFKWRMVQGIDFGHDNITFDVTSLEISYCPFVPTEELKSFFLQMKLDPEDLMSFTYQSWRPNKKLPSDFLTFMPNLELIDLRNNELDFLPTFTGLEYLTTLNLRGNRISSVPQDAFSTNKNLQEIRFAGNRLSKIEDNVFPASTRLLDLVNNEITSLSNGSFANLNRLEKLYLNNNPLQRVELGAFNGLKNLTELHMDSSKLFTLPVLKNLPKLTNLSISYSLFTSTKLVTTTDSYYGKMTTEMETTENPNFFSTTIRDDQIVFDESGAGTTTEAGGGTRYFQRARHSLLEDDSSEPNENSHNYNHNAHNKDSSDEELIGDLMALKKLVLINDDLKTLSWLGYLPNLTDLILSRNEIKLIPQGFFSKFPSVMHVDISKNAISDLTDLNAPNLGYLDLSNNFIRYIDRPHLSSLKNLKILSLASNKIDYIHPKAFENLGELIILDLSNNHISFNQGPPITGRSPLSSGNDHRGGGGGSSREDDNGMPMESPLQYCKRLEKVNLRNNLITKMFADWTFSLPWLSILDVSHNKIHSIHPRDLYFISRNVRADLRYNEITEVDMDFAEVLLEPAENKHVAVMLDGNPIHCDCRALAFKKFSMSSYLLQYTDLRCHTPPHLHGMKFRDVSENDLTCSIDENCPRGCNCVELPSENLIKINCYSIQFFRELGASLRNFTEAHDPYEFEVNLSNKNLQVLNESLIREITQQVRYVNLTGNKLTSLEFLNSVAEVNNITKFALSNNPFRCDGCKFQQIWWRHYQRISDIRKVTCVPGGVDGNKKGVGGTTEGRVLSFYELVKDTVCVEELISSEIRLLIILLGIFTPLVILAIACCTKQQKKLDRTSNKSSREGIARKKSKAPADHTTHNTRTFRPPRSKVVELDHSKF